MERKKEKGKIEGKKRKKKIFMYKNDTLTQLTRTLHSIALFNRITQFRSLLKKL